MAGPNGLKFIEDTHGGNRLKNRYIPNSTGNAIIALIFVYIYNTYKISRLKLFNVAKVNDILE